MDIDYSVVIRTTGKAGEKYRKLLQSIDGLTPRPREVIVVLPEDYARPEEQLGWETFYFSPKGMVIQRMTGIKKCKTRYALICDDDVCFGPDFVQKLYAPVRDGIGAFSVGPLYSFLPKPGFSALVDILTASAAPMVRHRGERYVSVLKSTGYSYNRHLESGKYYETQSAAWTCFFADIRAMHAIDFDDESWLDAHGYSALDDQTMFYKAWLRGYKTVVAVEALYEHLDAKTSTRNNQSAARYAGMFNRVVFWHRFIYSVQKNSLGRAASAAAFRYRILWMRLWDLVRISRGQINREMYQVAWKGYADGRAYIHSQAYGSLPAVCEE